MTKKLQAWDVFRGAEPCAPGTKQLLYHDCKIVTCEAVPFCASCRSPMAVFDGRAFCFNCGNEDNRQCFDLVPSSS